MVAITALSVPLYRLFCQVTGFGGTPRIERSSEINTLSSRSQALPTRPIEVRFDVNLGENAQGKLPKDIWDFQAPPKPIKLTLGETQTVMFALTNLTNEPHGSTSTFNVTPLKAGVYFVKTECFCFQEQIVPAHSKVEMPVVFYIDPKLANDPTLDDISTITLSYTLYDQGIITK